MHVVILASEPGWHTDELARATSARGLEPLLLPWDANISRMGVARGVSNSGHLLRDARAVIARIIPGGSLEQIIYRVDTLHRLEEDGVRVMNTARAIERTVDKAWTSDILERAGLATPETVACERADDAFAAFRAMGDVVVKPIFGSMGLGISRVSDEDMAWRVFRVVETVRGVYYLQRFIPHAGRDIRVFIVGGKVLGAMERSAPGWRTNFSRGGSVHAFELPPAVGRAGGARGRGGGGGICGRRPVARAGRDGLRPGSERYSRLGGSAAHDGDRRGRRNHRPAASAVRTCQQR